MVKFVLLVRVFQAILTLVAASFVVFSLARLTGSPADTMLPMDATPSEREALITRLGLDQPLSEQYWRYLKDAVRGDFGVSLRTKRPVTELVGDRLWNSLKLASDRYGDHHLHQPALGRRGGGLSGTDSGPRRDGGGALGAIRCRRFGRGLCSS